MAVAVLDVSQSGAFSQFDAPRVAVVAASTDSASSHESTELRGSYFTHELVVALRGAGDANDDGQVTLDEAYRYARDQTPRAAAGAEHLTFDADLGSLRNATLSFPGAASTAIVLPGSMAGEAIIWNRRSGEILADVYKAKGTPIRIATVPGDYAVVVRESNRRERGRAEPTTEPKPRRWWKPLRIELGLVTGAEHRDGYTRTLASFGYTERNAIPNASTGVTLTALREVVPGLWVGARAGIQFLPDWSQNVMDGPNVTPQTFRWNTTAVDAVARYMQPLGLAPLGIYAQADVGLAIGHAALTGDDPSAWTDVGPSFAAGAGFYLDARDFGVTIGYEYDYAPVIEDLFGDRHSTGGNRFTFALTERF